MQFNRNSKTWKESLLHGINLLSKTPNLTLMDCHTRQDEIIMDIPSSWIARLVQVEEVQSNTYGSEMKRRPGEIEPQRATTAALPIAY